MGASKPAGVCGEGVKGVEGELRFVLRRKGETRECGGVRAKGEVMIVGVGVKGGETRRMV